MTAVQELLRLVDAEDPYRNPPANLAELQMEALRERFEEKRKQIRVLAKRAEDSGIDSIRTFDDAVPLMFAHQTYKSYPEHFIDQSRWDRMNLWLQTLSSYPVKDFDATGVNDVDDWIARLRTGGHAVASSSGTSGKCSFMDHTIDDQAVAAACVVRAGVCGMALLARDVGKRPAFVCMPSEGSHRWIEPIATAAKTLARPTDIYFMFDEPATAGVSIRMGKMRRAMADGSAKPSEIAAFEQEAVQMQQNTMEQITRFVDKLLQFRDEPILLQAQWPMLWHVVQTARAKGIPDGSFHPDTAITCGGGLKGTSLPADFREQIFRFLGIAPENVQLSYGMSEMTGTAPWSYIDQGYAIPPWVVPLILDKTGEQLLNPHDGKGVVEGRMAFVDLLVDGHWGGIITGDKVAVDFSPVNKDGFKAPMIRTVARYADLEEGEDKLSCAGTMESYVRGMIEV